MLARLVGSIVIILLIILFILSNLTTRVAVRFLPFDWATIPHAHLLVTILVSLLLGFLLGVPFMIESHVRAHKKIRELKHVLKRN